MTDKWPPEPWRVEDAGRGKLGIRADGYGYIAFVRLSNANPMWEAGQPAAAERIVDCVNALTGVTDPEGFVKTANDLVASIEDLLEASDDDIRALIRSRIAACEEAGA